MSWPVGLAAHIWPSHHAYVNFYGTHTVDIDGELAKLDADGYRPLRPPAGSGVPDGVNPITVVGGSPEVPVVAPAGRSPGVVHLQRACVA